MTASDPRVGEIQARLDAATPGPWKLRECSPCTERGRLEVNLWDDAGNILITNWCDDDSYDAGDAEFIAAAPADVAYLLAELREAREALARMDAAAGRVEGLCLYWDGLADGDRYYASRVRAAVAAANGGGE